MSLLEKIIAEATAESTDIPRMLRLCMVLASRLSHQPFGEWVKHELEGYPETVTLPSYRVLRGRSRGHFVGSSFERELEIPTSVLPESIRLHIEKKTELRDCIKECAHLIEKKESDSKLQIPWPVDLAVKYGSKHVTNVQCFSAWIEISPAELAGMLDKITTKVLSFALAIEKEAPNAGEVESPDNQKIQGKQVTQIFNTTIQGDVQNNSVGGSNITQTAVGSVQVGDLDSLISVLKAYGVSEEEIASLRIALKRDKANGASGVGEAVEGWLDDLTIKARQGMAGIGADVVSQIIAQAILVFLGVS